VEKEQVVIGRTAEIPPGEGRTFEVGGKRIAVFHTRAGAFFATQADCPHKGGPLAHGMLGGTAVVCPLHERSWDLATGAPAAGSDCPIAVYPVRAAEDGTLVLAEVPAA
jgi:nitrite reductase (NADH) small subunit